MEDLRSTDSRERVKSLARLVSVVSLESLRFCAKQYTAVTDADGNTLETNYRCCLVDSFFVSIAFSGDSLVKLWLVSACRQGEDVEDGMATLGAALPRLEVLTTDSLRVTDRGWAAFAAARLASKRYLVSIRIKPPAVCYVPSEATRAVLMDAVTEILVLCGPPWDAHGRLFTSPLAVVDCEGRPVLAGRDQGRETVSSEKLCVAFDGLSKSNLNANADDL